jgi:tetratricopeptide (TPR) repeat protein
LGLWQDDINSNLAAIKASDKMASTHLHLLHHEVHSLDFLEYAYLQIGDDDNAKAIIDKLQGLRAEDMDPEFHFYLDNMKAAAPSRYAIERRQWREALQLKPAAGAPSYVQISTYWAHAVAAGHLHDDDATQDALKHYDELLEATRNGPKPYIADALKNEHQVVQAWAAYAGGKSDEALRLLRSVADHQDKVGKGETELPAREMLADMLLGMQHPQEALAEYETSLRSDPNRFNGLYGAAQAADMTQQKKKAAGYYAQLLKNCDGVRSDRPELTQAKTLLAAK